MEGSDGLLVHDRLVSVGSGLGVAPRAEGEAVADVVLRAAAHLALDVHDESNLD